MKTTSYTIIGTSFGQILVIGSEKGLRGISIHTSRRAATERATQRFPDAMESAKGFGDLPQRLERYAYGERIVFNDKLDLADKTLFQLAVLETTRTIPYGETRTYEWIAEHIGKPKSARAVGQALNRNPFPIIVPCHRVIGKDGSLTGFSAGIDIKKLLLDLEAK